MPRVGFEPTIPAFEGAAQPTEFLLDGLKKLEQRGHKCAERRGDMESKYFFFQSRSLLFFYKSKDLSASP
jgi:hypothetical protein